MSQYSELSEMRITLDLLCSVIVSDVCASGTEEQRISDLLRDNDSSWTDQEVRERIEEFAERKEQDGLELTVENLILEAKLLGRSGLLRAIEECLRLTSTDAEFGAHDNPAISRIQQLQTELQLKNTAERHVRAPGIPDFQITTDQEDHWRAPKSPDSQMTTALKTLGPVTPARAVVGLLTIGFAAWAVFDGIERNLTVSRFKRIEVGMTQDEVREILGNMPWRPRTRKSGPDTMTTVSWGERNPHYEDEFNFSLHLRDGVVTYAHLRRGTYRRN